MLTAATDLARVLQTEQLDQARRIHKCGIEVEKIGYGKLAEGIQDAAQRAERGWACKVCSRQEPLALTHSTRQAGPHLTS